MNRTNFDLSGESSSSFSSHHALIWLTMSCMRSRRGGRDEPRMTAAISSAKPWAISLFDIKCCSEAIRESMTRFQRRGDRTPPWGVPFIIYLMRAEPLSV